MGTNQETETEILTNIRADGTVDGEPNVYVKRNGVDVKLEGQELDNFLETPLNLHFHEFFKEVYIDRQQYNSDNVKTIKDILGLVFTKYVFTLGHRYWSFRGLRETRTVRSDGYIFYTYELL